MRKTTTTVFLLLVVVCTNVSCRLLGLTNEPHEDPMEQARKLKQITTRPAAVTHDSLIREMSVATIMVPKDLGETTLIVETYQYNDYLKTFENRFVIPRDDASQRRKFKRYSKKKESLLKNPKYKIAYLDKEEYNDLDFKNYRYVLKTTSYVEDKPDRPYVTDDDFVYQLVSTTIYYIYDRDS